MWNKLFKSKSKSSKNLSSSSNGSTSTAPVVLASPPLDLVPIYNHETDIDFRRNSNDNRDEHNRDSIGTQMCGIPMRKSKFSNAFKSLSLRRGSTKNQLKLYPGAGDIPVGDDEIEISTASKRASLRPSKSDNNLNEKQNYADQEKEDVVYSEQYIQQPVADPFLVIPEPPENLELQQCPICTRNFVPKSLAKHIGICEKMQSKKRKPFDSSRQRREGTELAAYLPKNFGLPQNHPQARVSPPKTTNPVRKLSTSKTPTPQRKDYGDNGINNLMSSSLTLSSTTAPTGNGPNAAMASSNSSSTTPRPILKRSLSQQNEPCPYCERCFGFKAFDRHVEWCREKALLTKNANNNNSISAAKERLQARIQYKAPQIKSKRALNREKYSGSLSCGGSTNSLADLDLPLPRHRSHLNSMSSSISSDNKSDHSGSLKKVSPPNGNNGPQQPRHQHQQHELIATSKHQTGTGSEGRKGGGAKKREIRANLLENENFMRGNNDSNNNPGGGKIFSNNLLIRPTQDVRREKEQAVAVERVEKFELIGRGGEQQRVPLKRGATKIVKCNKSDASFFNPTNESQVQALAKRSSLSCTAASGVGGRDCDLSSLRTVPSFDTYEEFFYYYEKQDRLLKPNESDHHAGEGFQDVIEDEELEIPFTNTIKMHKSGKRGPERGSRGTYGDGDGEEDFVPPFYDSNELRGGGGGGGFGEGPGGSSARKKGSRIPKKVARDRSLHQLPGRGLESHQLQDELETSGGGSGSGGTSQQQQMLSRRFCMERVESFDLARDRNEIIQYIHDKPSTGFTPDRYDPFMSAKRQLEELFSPSSGYNASTPRQQQQNSSRATTPLTPTANCMSKSVVTPTTKTSPVINSNFRRASSLRMPRKVSRPMFIEKAKSNIQKGITDDGPVSPNFLKSSEYDEIPVKSAFNALQMAEKPKMRDSSTTRKNLKLDIKDPNMPATDVPLSKTDSLAVFLKYEHELNLAAMSEKDMKDKSNSLSKRSLSLGGPERKESMLYGGVTGNGLKSDRSPQDEKDKAEKILQDIQPFKKLPQKLIPIKLEPINITYSNNNNSSQKTINNVNNSSKSNNITKNNNNNINSSNIGTSKPAVISLDAILGKKPKPPPPVPPPQEEKENRKDPNYIDPKLINKCDNLPMTATKLSSSESECSAASTVEMAKKPTDSNRLAESSNSSPGNSAAGETGGVAGEGQQPTLDNKHTKDSTNDDDSYDTRPTLTRQNGTASCSSDSSRRDSSREESPVEQQLRSPLARNQSHLDDTKPQTPDSGLERSTPKPSTPIPVQKKPERPPLPSFDDFDFDEFISSFEDERRSFKNALYARSTISNCNTSSSNSTSFIQHTNSSLLDNSVKSVTSLNGSLSSTSSPSHFNSSNSPHYNSLNNNGRSEETPTVTHQPKEPPQVPRRRHIVELVHHPSPSTIRNLPSLQGSGVAKPADSTPTDPRSPKAVNAFGPPNANINNNSSPHPRDTPSSSRLGSGNSFNPHHQPYQHHHQQQQQQQQQPSTANHTNNNTISAHLVPQPYTSATATNAGSPLFDYHGNSRHQSPLSNNANNNNNGSNGSGVGGPASGGGAIIFDDLSPTERDLMKSVQELDRMCESSSSMYPADSDEMSSVEGYPLSNSSRDHGNARHHHHHRSERPSAEGSKFSADSAYGSSLSRQSPPEQHHTIRRAYGHHRGGSKSTNATSQQDTFDNSSGSESSLPPITATLKTQKVELLAHKVSPAAAAATMGGAKNNATTSLQMSKFCHECGSRFMIDTAKFCMECGIRRIMLD